jgi:hypothetical protein
MRLVLALVAVPLHRGTQPIVAPGAMIEAKASLRSSGVVA